LSISYGIGTVGSHDYVWDTSALAWVAMSQPLVKTDNLTVTQRYLDWKTDTVRSFTCDGSGGEITSTIVGEQQCLDVDVPNVVSIKVVDTSAVAQGISIENGCIRTQNYLQAIAEGDITGHTPWTKIGYNGDIDNAEEDLIPQGGTYVWPAAQQQMDIVSTSTNDDGSPAGTGAQKVTIYYLTGAGVEKTEEVVMNGTTPVATTGTDLFRINAMRVTAVGGLFKADGNITLSEHSGTTYKYGYIVAGFTRMRQMVYTVPFGKTLYVTSIVVSGVNTSAGHWCRFTTRATYNDKSGSVLAANFFMPFHEILVVDQSFERTLEVPTKLPAGVDLKVTAISDAASANELCSCALRGWIE
jgi:hypothetical protein